MFSYRDFDTPVDRAQNSWKTNMNTGFESRGRLVYLLWSYRLSVRTAGFHPVKRGSIPRSSSKVYGAVELMINPVGIQISPSDYQV